MVKELQEQIVTKDLIKFILLMRFGTLRPTLQGHTFLPIEKIKKITKVPITLIKQILQISKQQIENCSDIHDTTDFFEQILCKLSKLKPQFKFCKEHIDFITDQKTLILQSGKSLQERCKLFHRQFPNYKISPSHLSNIYKQSKIKKKKILFTKKVEKPALLQKHQQLLELIKKQLNDIKKGGYKLIYLDEVMFTYQTQYNKDYSNKNEHIQIKESLLQTKTKAVIATISKECGQQYFQKYERSVDIPKFSEFIINLKQQYKNEKIALFLDNLRVHHSKKIKALCSDLEIQLIFNLPYSPEFNPTENFFSLVKNKYKREKLSLLSRQEKYKIDDLIDYSFNEVRKETIIQICQQGFQRVMKYNFDQK